MKECFFDESVVAVEAIDRSLSEADGRVGAVQSRLARPASRWGQVHQRQGSSRATGVQTDTNLAAIEV